MSMTYYAVTNDPNELAHFGIKGMKWGVVHDKPRHSGSRGRSVAYKKAQSKLGKMMKSGIKKAEVKWKTYNSPKAKYERQTNRAIEAARKGKLKYGKLTDEQVRRVTERLNLERQARQLADTEQTFRHRLAKSIGQGVITGVGTGFGNIVSEKISRGSKLKTKRMELDQQSYYDNLKDQRRIRNAERQEQKKYKLEQKRQDERARNVYNYDAPYDKEGKLDLTDPTKAALYYSKRYVHGGETREAAFKRQARELASERRKTERANRKSEAAMKRATALALKNATKGYGSAWDPYSRTMGASMKQHLNNSASGVYTARRRKSGRRK